MRGGGAILCIEINIKFPIGIYYKRNVLRCLGVTEKNCLLQIHHEFTAMHQIQAEKRFFILNVANVPITFKIMFIIETLLNGV